MRAITRWQLALYYTVDNTVQYDIAIWYCKRHSNNFQFKDTIWKIYEVAIASIWVNWPCYNGNWYNLVPNFSSLPQQLIAADWNWIASRPSSSTKACFCTMRHVARQPFLGLFNITHWGRDEMAAIFQTTFSNTFSWMEMCKLRLLFHCSLFPMVRLTIFQHWFRWWFGAVQATSHYLNQ